MEKTYICRACGYVEDPCKFVVDDDDHAPTLCPYLVGKRAYWDEVV